MSEPEVTEPDSVETPTDVDLEQFPDTHPLVVAFKSVKTRLQDRTDRLAAAEADRDRLAAVEAELRAQGEAATNQMSLLESSIPGKVCEELKAQLVELHGISQETADLFLADVTDTETLKARVKWIVGQSDTRTGLAVPTEGTNPGKPPSLVEQIALAEKSGDHAAALSLKAQQIAELALKQK